MIALPDVNVLVALTWPNHIHHPAAIEWFLTESERGWATCPVTESGFVRVSSNARVLPTARAPREAVEVLRRLRSMPGHVFWTDEVSLTDCPEIEIERLVGYRQVTDTHLLALAIRNNGRLVSFDRAIANLGGGQDSFLLLHG